MEEVKAYIESGILELYVLGQLTTAECREVEAMANKHPEVRAEINAIELAMEAYALDNAISPTTGLETKILAQLTEPKAKTKVSPLYKQAHEVRIKTLRYALMTSVALLVISIAGLFSLYSQLKLVKNQIVSLNSDKDKFASTISKLEFDKAGMQNQIDMTETTEWATVKLAGVKNSPKAKMLVYWNKKNKSILINHSAMDLPKTDDSHEYQLWALVDGKPISLGVFGSNAKEAVQQMETIQKAQAFAVTIEPMGGSANPTMEQMVVMGGVSI